MGPLDRRREARRGRRRDELLKRLEAVLRETERTRDFAHVLSARVARDANELTELIDEEDPQILWTTVQVLGWLQWYRFNALTDPERQAALDYALQAFTFCFVVGLETPGNLRPDLADLATPEAIEQFEQARDGDATDDELDDLVALWTRIVEATEQDSSTRPGRLWHLSTSLLLRYAHAENEVDLDEAITHARESVLASASEDHYELVGRLASLAEALRFRYRHADAPEALAAITEAIDATHRALEYAGDDHPDRTVLMVNLMRAWHSRSELTGKLDDLDEAIRVGRSVAEAQPAGVDHVAIVTNLVNRLIVRFGRTGDLADLDEAVRVGRSATESGGDRENLAMARSNLAGALRTRSERTGAIDDLHEAIRVAHDAVSNARDAHINPAMLLSNLAGVLQARFERTGALGDLDGAVDAGREAVRAAEFPAEDDVVDYAMYLSNLGGTLRIRSERAENLEALTAYLDEAITVGRLAVDTAADTHPRRAMMLTNLGGALLTRHNLTHDAGDLDAAIEVCREATVHTEDGHPDRAMTHANLSHLLNVHHDQVRDPASLDEAIAAARLAAAVTAEDHPHRARYLHMLGSVLHARFDRNRDHDTWEEARHTLEAAVAVPSAPPSVRIRAARAAAALASTEDPAGAATTLEAAVLLLHELTPHYLRRADRQFALGETAGLANDAAAAVLASAPADPSSALRALGLLEAGRAVLLSQSLQTRTDLTDLRAARPDLAARFVELRNLLDQDADAGTDIRPLTVHDNAADRVHLAGELTATLARIRAVERFESFASAPTIGELLPEATYGPVVTFNITTNRSDALLLTDDGVRLLPLPDLDFAALAEHITAFHQAVQQAADPDADRAGAQATLVSALAWLWDVAAGPVLAALGFDCTPSSDADWPRVWWVPGGLLGLLPLHAAGHHGDPVTSRRAVIDRVVSSYTPTIRALRHARQTRAASHVPDQSRSLIVAMPTTPGLPGNGRLRHVLDEADILSGLLPEPLVLVEGMETPTTARVLAEMTDRAVAHFACHGMHDAADPSRSRLLLHDHLATPLTVASLAAISLDHARLAYLSACETALTTSENLLDEAIHLASACQLAGFPHVIGTLWALDDEIAVQIAEDFYRGLHAPDLGGLETSRAAFALHSAIREQRDRYPDTPSLWAGHIHAGA